MEPNGSREAEAMIPGQKRMPWIIIGLVERERGRLEQAIKALEHANTIAVGHIPSLNQRASTAVEKDLAVLHAEVGHGDVARAIINRIEPGFVSDPKRMVTFDASAAAVHAFLHEREPGLARIAAAEAGLLQVPDDGTARRATLSLLARAALQFDQPERTSLFSTPTSSLNPNPLYLTYAYYHLAECRRRLGDVAGGQALDRKAASAGIDNRWERHARERLGAEGVARIEQTDRVEHEKTTTSQERIDRGMLAAVWPQPIIRRSERII